MPNFEVHSFDAIMNRLPWHIKFSSNVEGILYLLNQLCMSAKTNATHFTVCLCLELRLLVLNANHVDCSLLGELLVSFVGIIRSFRASTYVTVWIRNKL